MSGEARTQIRWPAFSGLIYPADPFTLKDLIANCLGSNSRRIATKPYILIVPCASCLFSGDVAGAGFVQVRDSSRIILLGVAHRSRFEGAAVYAGAFWETPLGKVAVDQAVTSRLINIYPTYTANNAVHRYEHTLEIQLPFLQQVLGDFRIVPLLLGNPHVGTEVSDAIADVFDEQTLLIVSTNLSQFACQSDAESIDCQTIDAILSLNPEHFQATITTQMQRGVPGLVTCAEGAAAIEVALQVACRLHLTRPYLLAYQNSGQIRGEPHRVTGYASVAICC